MSDFRLGNSVWAPLRLIDFRYLLVGQLFTGMLAPLSFIVLAFWVLEEAPEGWEIVTVGAMGTIRGASWLTLGLYLAALADRFDRRKLLLVIQVIGFTLTLTMAAIVEWIGGGALGLTLFFLAAFVMAGVQPADMIIRNAVASEMLGPRTQTGLGLMLIVMQGPALVLLVFSGVLIDELGFTVNFFLMAGFYAFNALTFLPMRYRTVFERTAEPAAGGFTKTWQQAIRDVRSGFRYARGDTVIFWSIALVTVSVALTQPAIGNLSPIWLREVLDEPTSTFGKIVSPWVISGTIAALVLTGMPFIERKARLIVLGSLLFPASVLVFSLPQTVESAFIAHFGFGASFSMTHIAAGSLVEYRVPNEMRGRVMSLVQLNMGISQLMTLGIAGVGQLVSLTTLIPVIGAVSLVGVALLAVMHPHVWRDRVPREAMQEALRAERQRAMGLDPGEG